MLYPLSYEDNDKPILPYTSAGGDMSVRCSRLPFFVYGTLLPGQPNDGYWLGGIRTQRPAVMPRARLFDQGTYPILVEGGPGMARGLVITVGDTLYPLILNTLDYLEGYDSQHPETAEYRRVRRVVRLLNDQPVAAWVYVGRPDQVRDLAPVGSDWKQYTLNRQRSIDRG